MKFFIALSVLFLLTGCGSDNEGNSKFKGLWVDAGEISAFENEDIQEFCTNSSEENEFGVETPTLGAFKISGNSKVYVLSADSGNQFIEMGKVNSSGVFKFRTLPGWEDEEKAFEEQELQDCLSYNGPGEYNIQKDSTTRFSLSEDGSRLNFIFSSTEVWCAGGQIVREAESEDMAFGMVKVSQEVLDDLIIANQELCVGKDWDFFNSNSNFQQKLSQGL